MTLKLEDVMSMYEGEYWVASEIIPEGSLHVCVFKHEEMYHVWNKHPLRVGWQKVYTLESCNPYEQCVESIQSLKRLFEKE